MSPAPPKTPTRGSRRSSRSESRSSRADKRSPNGAFVRAISRLFEPPRLRTLQADQEDDRRATWLELLFDPVFVAAVGQLANALSAQPTTGRFLEFLGLFVPVWWVWMGFTFYANRFDTDDLPYRLLTLLGMFAVAVLATTIPSAFRGGLARVSARICRRARRSAHALRACTAARA